MVDREEITHVEAVTDSKSMERRESGAHAGQTPERVG